MEGRTDALNDSIRLADCYLRYAHQAEQEDAAQYHVITAIWCDDPTAYPDAARALLANSGLTLLHAEPSLPASEWLERTPSDEARRLVAQAQERRNDVFGLLRESVRALRPAARSYLRTEVVEGVEPLGQQFGVHPKKTVPDPLYQRLFGEVEPTAAEIAEYGDAQSVPPMKLYAILDAAAIPFPENLPSMLEYADTPHQCVSAEMKPGLAPWLVALEPELEFTRILFSHLPHLSDKMASAHLWHINPGIYLRSRASLATLAELFSGMAHLSDAQGEHVIFRYYSPRVLPLMLQSLQYAPDYLAHWFTSVHSYLCYDSQQAVFLQLSATEQFRASEHAPPAVCLDSTYQRAFEQMRLDDNTRQLSDAIRHDYAEQCTLDDQAFAAVVRQGVQDARQLGLRCERAVGQYVAACCLLGRPVPLAELEQIPGFFDPTEHENRRTQRLLDSLLQRQPHPQGK